MTQANTETLTSGGSHFVPKEKLSYEEFLVKYDGQYGQYAEYVDGEVVENISVTERHDLLVGFFANDFDGLC